MAEVLPGTLQLHWPEALALIDRTKRSPPAGVPDYNALVRIEPVARGAGGSWPSPEGDVQLRGARVEPVPAHQASPDPSL